MVSDRLQVLLSACCMIPTVAGRLTDLAVVLTQVHHFASSHNTPLAILAGLLARLVPALIVEFVTKMHCRVRPILESLRDVFDRYAQQGCEAALLGHFSTKEPPRAWHAASRFCWIERQGGAG